MWVLLPGLTKHGVWMYYKLVLSILITCLTLPLAGQKVGFVSSKTIRAKYNEAKQADQRIQSIVEEWKRELESMQQQIDDLEFEIKKNRLIWSDDEKFNKETELKNLKEERVGYAQSKFESGGEYDKVVKSIMSPVEIKIYAAVQEVAADEGYDIILDQSIQPIPYVNYKYDMTVKVLRKLGVDVEQMEKELKEKIDNDPRNKQVESRRPVGRSRRRFDPDDKKDEPERVIRMERAPKEEPEEEGESEESEVPVPDEEEEENK